MRSRILLALIFVVGFATRSSAQARFSAVVSGYHTGGCFFLAFPVSLPSAEWVVEPTEQTFLRSSDDVYTLASADGQTVFATLRPTTAHGLRIARLVFDTSLLNNGSHDFFEGLPDYFATTALAVAKNGDVFAVVEKPVSGGIDWGIAVISSTGILERIVPVNSTLTRIAVAADNCTVLYTSGSFDGAVIRRVNACTGVSMPVFATASQRVTGLATMTNGDAFVTTVDTLQRFNAGGVLVQNYSIRNFDQDALDAVAVSSDERVVAVAAMGYCENRGQIIALSTADGHEFWRRETSFISTATGLAVGSLPAAIPLLPAPALALLGAVLSAIALSCTRR